MLYSRKLMDIVAEMCLPPRGYVLLPLDVHDLPGGAFLMILERNLDSEEYAKFLQLLEEEHQQSCRNEESGFNEDRERAGEPLLHTERFTALDPVENFVATEWLFGALARLFEGA